MVWLVPLCTENNWVIYVRKPPISIVVGLILIVLGVFALSWAYNIWERINFLEVLISTPFMLARFEMELEIRILQPQLTFATGMGIALLACGTTLIVSRKWLPLFMVICLAAILASLT